MKKLILIIIILLIPLNIHAKEAALVKCIDGDTAAFMIDNKQETVRFLAIDTPESTNKKELWGDEASSYTCNSLKNASSIRIELDPNSDIYDRYNRLLGWVFVDDILLQKMIVENGYGKVAYLYGDYKYTDILISSEQSAKASKLRIWSKTDNSLLYYIIFIIIVLGSLLLTTKQKKVVKRLYKLVR
jgi:micrococcal nuclease